MQHINVAELHAQVRTLEVGEGAELRFFCTKNNAPATQTGGGCGLFLTVSRQLPRSSGSTPGGVFFCEITPIEARQFSQMNLWQLCEIVPHNFLIQIQESRFTFCWRLVTTGNKTFGWKMAVLFCEFFCLALVTSKQDQSKKNERFIICMLKCCVVLVSVVFTLLAAGLQAESEISLSGKDLTAVSAEEASTIKTLMLTSVSQEDVPDGVFSSFTSLENLYFSSSNVQNITSNMFAGLTSLRILDMEESGVQYVEDFAFRQLGNLRKLNLRNNNIRIISHNTLKGLVSLEMLDLSSGWMPEIPADGFADLHALRDLNLMITGVEEIKQEWWRSLPLLEKFAIGASLKEVPDNAFGALTNLQRLEIQYVVIDTVRGGQWTGLGSLKHLTLSRCQITMIEAGAFSELGELVYLSLFVNLIHTIHPDMWLGLNSLRTLWLEFNNITHIPPRGFSNLPMLNKLGLGRNLELKRLPMNVFDPQYFEDGHPKDLTLGLSYVSLVCDESLCWLKEGEEGGWIHWLYMSRPDCLDTIGC